MNIHEYQAKEILKSHHIPIQQGKVAETVEEAVKAATSLDGPLHVVKAQILAGGRGKAGGVILAKSIDEVKSAAEKLLGKKLVTHQTGPLGELVKQIYIELGVSIQQEYYLSLTIDPKNHRFVFVGSAAGGVDIESLAGTDKIVKVPVDPTNGLQAFHCRKILYGLGIPKEYAAPFFQIVKNVYEIFTRHDAQMIEINPLVLTTKGDWYALDAKMGFDDNALFRHPELASVQSDSSNDIEQKAKELDLNYVKLDGDIGCMVNGAGLAMATMDIIKYYGGNPANFLDVGGGADKERVSAAFKLILQDPNIKAVFVNIFGGIMRCDIIAQGIVDAAKEMNINVPIVVRLQGTNSEEGKKIMEASGLSIMPSDDFSTAAQLAVTSAQK